MNYKISTQTLKLALFDIFHDNKIDIPTKNEVTAWKQLMFSHDFKNSIFTTLHQDIKNGINHNPSIELINYLQQSYSKDIDKCLELIQTINSNNYKKLESIFSNSQPLKLELINSKILLNDEQSFLNFYLNYDDDTVDISSNKETMDYLLLEPSLGFHPINTHEVIDEYIEYKILNSQIGSKVVMEFSQNPHDYQCFLEFAKHALELSQLFNSATKISYIQFIIEREQEIVKKHLKMFLLEKKSEEHFPLFSRVFPLSTFDELSHQDFKNDTQFLQFLEKIYSTQESIQNIIQIFLKNPEIYNSKTSGSNISLDIQDIKTNTTTQRKFLEHLDFIKNKVIEDPSFVLSKKLQSQPFFILLYPLLPLEIREKNSEYGSNFFSYCYNYSKHLIDQKNINPLLNFIPKSHLDSSQFLTGLVQENNPIHESTFSQHVLSSYFNKLINANENKMSELLFQLPFLKIPFKIPSSFLENQNDYLDEQFKLMSSDNIKCTTFKMFKQAQENQMMEPYLLDKYISICQKVLALAAQNKSTTTINNQSVESFYFIFQKIFLDENVEKNEAEINLENFKNTFHTDIKNCLWNNTSEHLQICIDFFNENIISLNDILNYPSFKHIKNDPLFWNSMEDKPFTIHSDIQHTGLSKNEFKTLLDLGVNPIPFLKYTSFGQQYSDISINKFDFWKNTFEKLPESSPTFIHLDIIPKQLWNNLDFCILAIKSKALSSRINGFSFPEHILSSHEFISTVIDTYSPFAADIISQLCNKKIFSKIFDDDDKQVFSSILNENILLNSIPENNIKHKTKKF